MRVLSYYKRRQVPKVICSIRHHDLRWYANGTLADKYSIVTKISKAFARVSVHLSTSLEAMRIYLTNPVTLASTTFWSGP
eukprot:2865108-Amphidinium_carterae.1